MKKVIFALAVAGMFTFAACGGNDKKDEAKPEEPKQEVKDEPKDEVKAEEAQEVAPVDNNARQQAIDEAAQKICNCASGDQAKIQECLKSVISTGYAAYQNDESFTKAVYDKAFKCAAEQVATKAIEKGTEKAAEELSKQAKNIKISL